ICEMGLYLRLTEIAFFVLSLFAEGGQNPLEPAMLGCAILSCGHVQNFRHAPKPARRAAGRRHLISSALGLFLRIEQTMHVD
ncbi:hypothetical protein ACC754_42205, partial [Rhizobium johnstonii]